MRPNIVMVCDEVLERCGELTDALRGGQDPWDARADGAGLHRDVKRLEDEELSYRCDAAERWEAYEAKPTGERLADAYCHLEWWRETRLAALRARCALMRFQQHLLTREMTDALSKGYDEAGLACGQELDAHIRSRMALERECDKLDKQQPWFWTVCREWPEYIARIGDMVSLARWQARGFPTASELDPLLEVIEWSWAERRYGRSARDCKRVRDWVTRNRSRFPWRNEEAQA